MNPGKLNKRIVFLKQPAEKNSFGEPKRNAKEWIEVGSAWANVWTMTGRALYQANQVHAEVTTKVIIRFRKDIEAKMRIRYGERILEIAAPPINLKEENRYLELSCKEVV